MSAIRLLMVTAALGATTLGCRNGDVREDETYRYEEPVGEPAPPEREMETAPPMEPFPGDEEREVPTPPPENAPETGPF